MKKSFVNAQNEWPKVKLRWVEELKELVKNCGSESIINRRLQGTHRFKSFKDDPIDLLNGILDGSIEECPVFYINWLKRALEKDPPARARKRSLRNEDGEEIPDRFENTSKPKAVSKGRVDLNEPYLHGKNRLEILDDFIARHIGVTALFREAVAICPAMKPGTINSWFQNRTANAEQWKAVEQVIMKRTNSSNNGNHPS